MMLNRRRSRFAPAIGLTLVVLALAGCASTNHKPTEAQRQFAAGQEDAFAMLERSGIHVVRVVGPFQRPVILWHKDMTLSQVILQAGYLQDRNPHEILIRRGASAISIDPADLLRGEDIPVESGDVIQVLP